MTRPILFNTEMVRAILDGRKTVTRRVVNPRYRNDEGGFQVITTTSGEFVRVEKVDENECGTFPDGSERYVNSPYAIGDILYVRETWQFIPCIDCDKSLCQMKSVLYESADMIGEGCFVYKEDYLEPKRMSWKPSIHMPKAAARIFLRVTEVRVEKLHDMTDAKSQQEGFESASDFAKTFFKLYSHTDGDTWVWVIEFKRCENPEIQLSATLGMVSP